MNTIKESFYDLKKYWDYFFETKGFTLNGGTAAINDHAIQAAKVARGAGRGPVVFIHGIMPRSGTVYAGELLRLHPEISHYPHQLWEFPALQLTADILELQQKFLRGYKKNRDKLGTAEFLPLFGASLIAFLHEPIPPDKRVLAKMPNVQYLNYFFSMFPHENLLILLRDGRDLVHSTLRTWPNLNFVQVCLRWNRSARMILNSLQYLNEEKTNGFLIAKYEDALENPEAFVREACCRFSLDVNTYPFEKIKWVRVVGSSHLSKEKNKKVEWSFIRRPADFRPVAYWRNWSLLRKQVFKVIAGRSLMDLGYCKDMSW